LARSGGHGDSPSPGDGLERDFKWSAVAGNEGKGKRISSFCEVITMLKYVLLILCVCALLPSLSHADEVALLVIDADSYAVNEALKKLDPPKNIKVCFFTHADIQDSQAAREFIQGSEVIVADVMQPQITDYLLENVNTQSRPVYALRGSNDDQKLKSKGFRFEPTIQAYFQNLSVQNIPGGLHPGFFPQVLFGSK
jgi:hypothetical protein